MNRLRSDQSSDPVGAVVSRLAADPPRTGLLLDFDGTLTPIVADPTTSALSEELADVLARLAARLAAVAVVSGRPAGFLAERVDVPGVRRLGLYGLEDADETGEVRARPEAEAWRDEVVRATSALREATAVHEGVWVEDKGLSVAVHWRRAADREAAGAACERLVADVAATTGLAREPGKLVEELRPPVAWDKGAALRALVSDLELALIGYVGDDLGDLPALTAARDLGGVAVVVDHGEETPARLRAIADCVVHGVDGVTRLLAALAARLG